MSASQSSTRLLGFEPCLTKVFVLHCIAIIALVQCCTVLVDLFKARTTVVILVQLCAPAVALVWSYIQKEN